VIVEPKEEQDDKAKFKYPFYSSEIFGSKVTGITNYLFKDYMEEEKDEVGSNESFGSGGKDDKDNAYY